MNTIYIYIVYMNFLMVKNNNDKHCIYDLSRYVWKVIFFKKKKKKRENVYELFSQKVSESFPWEL